MCIIGKTPGVASMMWDSSANASEVIDEFLEGYYSSKAAPHVRAFIERMQKAARASGVLKSNTGMPNTWPTNGPDFLNASNFETLLDSNADFVSAFAAVEGPDSGSLSETASRLRRAYQAVLYPSLWRWDELRAFATQRGLAWPLPASKSAAFADFARTYNETKTAGIVYNNYYSIPKPCVYGCALQWLHECIMTTKCPANGHTVPKKSVQLKNDEKPGHGSDGAVLIMQNRMSEIEAMNRWLAAALMVCVGLLFAVLLRLPTTSNINQSNKTSEDPPAPPAIHGVVCVTQFGAKIDFRRNVTVGNAETGNAGPTGATGNP